MFELDLLRLQLPLWNTQRFCAWPKRESLSAERNTRAFVSCSRLSTESSWARLTWRQASLRLLICLRHLYWLTTKRFTHPGSILLIQGCAMFGCLLVHCPEDGSHEQVRPPLGFSWLTSVVSIAFAREVAGPWRPGGPEGEVTAGAPFARFGRAPSVQLTSQVHGLETCADFLTSPRN